MRRFGCLTAPALPNPGARSRGATTRWALLLSLVVAFGAGAAFTSAASAAPVTIVDQGGVDDVSGQRDLNSMTVDLPANAFSVAWTWDDTAWSGNNTGDACALFDTNGDGNVNVAVCVSVGGNPAAEVTNNVFTCTDQSDGSCTGNSLPTIAPGSTCSVTQALGEDPFRNVNSHGSNSATNGANAENNDTRASCLIPLALAGGAGATLTNVCSYASAVAHSGRGDCIRRQSHVSFTKVVVNDNGGTATPGQFALVLSRSGGSTTIQHGESASVSDRPYTLTEDGPVAGYVAAFSCVTGFGGPNILTGNPPRALDLRDDVRSVSCTVTNNDRPATVSFTKTVVNNSGGSATPSQFTLVLDPASGPNINVAGGANVIVPPGVYGVTEAPMAGYRRTALSCNPALVNGTLTVARGATISCAATNHDKRSDLSIRKTDGVNSVTAGGQTTYTIVVTNNGPHTMTGAPVTDILPAAVASATWTCAATPTTACAATTGSGNIATTVTLAPNASATFKVTANIAPGAAGVLTNTAVVGLPPGVDADDEPENNQDSDTDRIKRVADLAVTKSDGSPTYVPGGPITYAIGVTNSGPSTATNVTVTDTIPSVISTTAADITCTATGIGASCGAKTLTAGVLTFTDGALPVGGTLAITINGTVSPSAVLNPLTNTASATAAEDLGPNTATDLSTPIADVDLVVVKSVDASVYTPGAPVTYIVTVTNTGLTTATGVSLSDPLPAAIQGATATCSAIGGALCGTVGVAGNAVTVTGATLPRDLTATPAIENAITITINGTISASARETIVNTATASAPGAEPASDDATSTLNPVVDIDVTKTDGSATYTPGGPITYVIEVANKNAAPASFVTVTDQIPAAISGATWTCVGSGGASCGQVASGTGNVAISGASLPGSAQAKLRITVTGTVSPSATGSLVNTASAQAVDVKDANPENNSATDTDRPAPMSDLSVVKTDGQTSAVPGTGVTYTVTVSNSGPSDVVNATVSDPIPASLAGATWTCVPDPGATCASGSGAISDVVAIPAGKKVVYTFKANIAADAVGVLANTATVTGPAGVDPNPVNNTATDADALVPSADLVLVKAADRTSGDRGTGVTFTLTATNRGPSVASGVTISDALPAGLTLVRATPSQGTCSGAVECQLGAIAPGASATVRIEATLSGAGEVRNVARVSAATADPDPANNESVAAVQILPVVATLSTARLTIAKSGPRKATVGTTVTYTVRVSVPRSSPVAARSVVVQDVLPVGMTLVGKRALARSGKVRIAKGTVVVSLGDIRPGGTRTVQISVRIATTARGRLVNIATAKAANAAPATARAATQVADAVAVSPLVTG